MLLSLAESVVEADRGKRVEAPGRTAVQNRMAMRPRAATSARPRGPCRPRPERPDNRENHDNTPSPMNFSPLATKRDTATGDAVEPSVEGGDNRCGLCHLGQGGESRSAA